MTVHDGHRLPDALDDLAERSLTPKVLLAEKHYGSADNMTLADERSIDLTAPARTAKGGPSGRLTLEDFRLNGSGLVLKCPNGVAPVATSASTAKLQARFDLAICRECPERARCPVQAEKHDGQFARFQYTPTRAENQKRRLHESSDAFRDTYRWRDGIEATMSRLKYQMNLANLRIRGMPAMRYTVNLRALGRPIPHPGHFHRYRADPGLNLPFGQMTVPDQPPAASGISLISMGGEKTIQLGLDRLCDQLPCALPQQIRQRVGRKSGRRAKRDNRILCHVAYHSPLSLGPMARHGSFSARTAARQQRLDMPPNPPITNFQLQLRPGWPEGILEGSGWGKPKGMHWRTYERLSDGHDTFTNTVNLAPIARFGASWEKGGLIGAKMPRNCR